MVKSRLLVSRPSILIMSIVVLAMALAACGGAGLVAEDSTTTTPPESPTTIVATTVTTGQTATTEPAPATTPPGSSEPATATTPPPISEPPSTSVPPSTTTTVPGEMVDYGPVSGDVLAVVGVRHDDVLNVRSGPGVGFPVIAKLAPTADDVVALGKTWSLPGALWIEVEAEGTDGWVNLAYVSYLGDTNDATAGIVDGIGETPRAETMLDLGLVVAEAVAGDSEAARIVVSVAPTVGDLGEVTYDVVGFGDDSVLGARLHVFGQPDEGGEGFVLKSVELTVMCSRGVSAGACV